MPSVQTFRPGLVIDLAKKYCDGHSLRYITDDDGDLVLPFGDVGIIVHLIATGSMSNVYHILCQSTKTYDMARHDKGIELCNQWNEEKRWPKAYTSPDGDSFGIKLEQELDLQEGIHQELFDAYTTTAIAAFLQFWEWLPSHL